MLRGTHRVGSLRHGNRIAMRLSTRRTNIKATAYKPNMRPRCQIPIARRDFRFALHAIGWVRCWPVRFAPGAWRCVCRRVGLVSNPSYHCLRDQADPKRRQLLYRTHEISAEDRSKAGNERNNASYACSTTVKVTTSKISYFPTF